ITVNKNTNISFIPKKPLAQKEILKRGNPALNTVTLFLFLTLFLVTGVAIIEFVCIERKEAEKIQVTKQLIEYNKKLQEEEVIKDIENIRILARKIKTAKNLLNKHIAPTGIFAFLEETTPRYISFSNFAFQKSQEKIKVTMSGQATSYETLAAFSQLYRRELLLERLESYSLTNFSTDKTDNQSGVSFAFAGTFKPQVVSYYFQQTKDFQEK
ncbi:hypothetical protein KKA89_02860, partial [Patescibacteria group bacterium]|nr:hypothetical protein [Patescibacteria group bacterium]